MAADRDLRTFIACGRALGGDNWHGEMARLTRFTRPYITMIANEQRPVSDEVRPRSRKA
jgi:hypothetical protein